MALKNYTSQVPASRSVAYIEAKLVVGGAKHIMKEYGDDQRLIGISFIINLNGQEIPFKLPAKIKECEKVLQAELSPRARPETRKAIPQQAERTAWKILLDWVEAQMAMVELAQVDMAEVFMPYLYSPQQDKTLYEISKENGFKQLGM